MEASNISPNNSPCTDSISLATNGQEQPSLNDNLLNQLWSEERIGRMLLSSGGRFFNPNDGREDAIFDQHPSFGSNAVKASYRVSMTDTLSNAESNNPLHTLHNAIAGIESIKSASSSISSPLLAAVSSSSMLPPLSSMFSYADCTKQTSLLNSAIASRSPVFEKNILPGVAYKMFSHEPASPLSSPASQSSASNLLDASRFNCTHGLPHPLNANYPTPTPSPIPSKSASSHEQHHQPQPTYPAPQVPAKLEKSAFPLSCPEADCNKVFTNTKNFNSHMIKHIARNPFKCSLCSESIKRRGDFLRHIRVVHGREASVRCPWCLSYCQGLTGLKTHLGNNFHAESGPFLECLTASIEFKSRTKRKGVNQPLHLEQEGFQGLHQQQSFQQDYSLQQQGDFQLQQGLLPLLSHNE